MNSIEYTDFIMHHGIKGQRWGIRRFQNEDGSLTPAGAKRYGTSITFGYDTGNRKVREIAGKEIDEANKAWTKYWSSRNKSDLDDFNKKQSAIGKKLIDNKEQFMSKEGRERYEKDNEKKYKKRVDEINKLYDKYEKAYGKSIKKVYNNSETGNQIVIYNKKQKEKADKYFEKHKDVFEKTMEELRGSSRSVGLDFVTGKYNLRTVDNTDGKDYWTLLHI